MMDEKSLINQDRSIIVACDVLEVEQYEKIVRETHTHPVIGGYKIGFSLALKYGLPAIVELTRSYTNKPIIYDHQKAGTDIPYTGKLFMAVMREAGIDSVILFPLTGPKTLEEWIKAAHANDLHVIVGGLMTHHQFSSNEGGYICEGNKGVYAIYKQAAELGIKDFVVPGNKPGKIKKIRNLLSAYVSEPVFYSPGLISQGGEITEAGKAAGGKWHAIIGRVIYDSTNLKETLDSLYNTLKTFSQNS